MGMPTCTVQLKGPDGINRVSVGVGAGEHSAGVAAAWNARVCTAVPAVVRVVADGCRRNSLAISFACLSAVFSYSLTVMVCHIHCLQHCTLTA
jgi:hypothetical protein